MGTPLCGDPFPRLHLVRVQTLHLGRGARAISMGITRLLLRKAAPAAPPHASRARAGISPRFPGVSLLRTFKFEDHQSKKENMDFVNPGGEELEIQPPA